ncbi:MAG: D-alanine--D-alanine ligase [Candidatus Eisenbacteria bacterium]|uniref:D-alanine--D-alanine ligase n=1 Tax=Eiseniibacteriota bacterium TaxID=2212470 RepID=A0A849SLT6_UNCEI|nr:D-alanine--D-alanine ligase [Candidatus Eisenbacteria bacterium]
MKVAILMGGRSSEREISLRSGRGIAQALRNLGHEALSIDAADGRLLPAGNEELGAPALESLAPADETVLARPETLATAEVVFLALHGAAGENGTIQALLDLAGRPYTGSGMLASALAMNKAMSKRLFEREGVPTPAWQLLAPSAGPADVDVEVLGGFPIIVKPNEEGSSFGLTVVRSVTTLPGALREAGALGEILIEKFIEGRELTVAVLGDESLPIVEIRPKSGLYDYQSKYAAGASEYFCPAVLPDDVARRVAELGVRAARILGCRGVSRADFRLSDDQVPYCLEVNTIPGMTPTSLVPMAAKAAGMSYEQLVARMLDLAVAQRRPPGVPTRA